MSGSPFAEWAASDYVIEESARIIEELDCFHADSNKIKTHMQEITIDQLRAAYRKLVWTQNFFFVNLDFRQGTTRPGLSPILYTPLIDSDFFPKPFGELIKEAPRKSILSGFASQEGAKLSESFNFLFFSYFLNVCF